MSDKEKDYENIPANEWDYDWSDLLDKFDSYIDDAIHNEVSTDFRDISDYFEINYDLIKQFVPKIVSPPYSVKIICESLKKYAQSLNDDQHEILIELLELVDLTFEWSEDDQCFYEDCICL